MYEFIENELKPHERENGELPIGMLLIDFLKTLPLVNPRIFLNGKELFDNEGNVLIDIDDTYRIQSEDTIYIVNQVKGTIALVIAVSLATSYALSVLLAPKISTPTSTDSTSGTTEYSITTSQNQARKGEPIPECFGTYLRNPDIIAPVYYRYHQNKEYMYMLLCLGVGQHTIENIYIDDTDVNELTSGTFYSRLYKTESEHTGVQLIQNDWANNVSLDLISNTLTNTLNTPITTTVASFTLEPNSNETSNHTFYFNFSSTNSLPEGAVAYGTLYVYIDLYKDSVFKETRKYSKFVGAGRSFGFNIFVESLIGTFDEARIRRNSLFQGYATTESCTLKKITYLETSQIQDTYFRDIVVTSTEIENFKLTTEDGSEMSLTTVASENIHKTEAIEFDINFPNGLYTQNSDGTLRDRSVTIRFTIVDNNNVETTYDRTITNNTRDQIRESFYFTVTAGYNFMVKAERVTEDATDTKIQDAVYCERIKAYLKSESGAFLDYGDVTLMAVKIKATEGISGKGQFKVKVKAKRDGLATLKDAIEYVWSDSNGGRQDINKLSLPTSMNNVSYNHFIEKRTTVLKTLQSMSSNSRYSLYSSFGTMTARLDESQPIRKMMFNETNIVRDSLKITMSAKDGSDYDGVRVIYKDSETFEDKYYTFPSTADFPQDISLDGVTDDDIAIAQAKYNYYDTIYRNKKYEFDTELDGLVPSLYDRCAITHPILKTSQSGFLSGFTSTQVELNEAIREDYSDPYIFFRGRDGKPSALYHVTNVDGRVLTIDVSTTALPNDLYVGQDEQRTIYSMGDLGFIDDIIITEIKPKANNKISIKAWNYDENVYL